MEMPPSTLHPVDVLEEGGIEVNASSTVAGFADQTPYLCVFSEIRGSFP